MLLVWIVAHPTGQCNRWGRSSRASIGGLWRLADRISYPRSRRHAGTRACRIHPPAMWLPPHGPLPSPPMGRVGRSIPPHARSGGNDGGCPWSSGSHEAAAACGCGRRHASSWPLSALCEGNALALGQGMRLGKRRGRRLRLRRVARSGSARPVRNGTRSCRVGPPVRHADSSALWVSRSPKAEARPALSVAERGGVLAACSSA